MDTSIGRKLGELNRLIHRYTIKRKLSDIKDSDDKNAGSATMANICIIGYLYDNRNSDVYQKDLDEALKVRRSTLSKELSLMEQKGFIKRVYGDSDKRMRKIVLCDKSLPLAIKLKEEHELLEKKLTKGISDDELSSFLSTLSKLTDNLREENL